MTAGSDRIRAWRADPVLFVRDVFGVAPDDWQLDALTKAGGPPNPARKLCMKACTGPGKSAVLAWLGWHRLLCFAAKGEHPKGAALSVSADNLKDNLWAELAKWQGRSDLLMAAFKWTKETIYAVDHAETWFLSKRSYAKDADAEAIGRALSGLHSQFPFVLLDETGEMPVAVGRAAQQIFTGNPTDALIAQAGNPTSTNGLLYESAGRGGWDVVTITADPLDPKRTPRVSVEHAQAMIDEYGRDNPWVMATILGLFPPTGFNALIGLEQIEAAMRRHYTPEHYRHAAVILGGDVARQGDDKSVLARRQGVVLFPLKSYRIPDTMLVADAFGQEFNEHRADALFVDETGGYGAGVVDALRMRNFQVTGVQFAGKPSDPRYFNKRSEMLFKLCEWIKTTGAIPPDAIGLREELLALEYTFQGDKFAVIPKEKIKDKIGRSPDESDAAALTFAYDVMPGPRDAAGNSLESMVNDSYLPRGDAAGPYNPMG
jgi:hypothetical protein